MVSGQVLDKIQGKIALGGEPAEIAQIALFLVSGRSRYITGANINANGGMAPDCRGMDKQAGRFAWLTIAFLEIKADVTGVGNDRKVQKSAVAAGVVHGSGSDVGESGRGRMGG